MSSQKRIDASRKNGALGGPKTPDGKQKSSGNAYKHGHYSRRVLALSTEEQRQLDKLRAAMYDEWQPATATGEIVVEELILASWHMLRYADMEMWLMEEQMSIQAKDLEQKFGKRIQHELRMATAFRGCLESSPVLAHIQGERNRLHRMQSRCIRTLLLLRDAQGPSTQPHENLAPANKNERNEPTTPVTSTLQPIDHEPQPNANAGILFWMPRVPLPPVATPQTTPIESTTAGAA